MRATRGARTARPDWMKLSAGSRTGLTTALITPDVSVANDTREARLEAKHIDGWSRRQATPGDVRKVPCVEVVGEAMLG